MVCFFRLENINDHGAFRKLRKRLLNRLVMIIVVGNSCFGMGGFAGGIFPIRPMHRFEDLEIEMHWL